MHSSTVMGALGFAQTLGKGKQSKVAIIGVGRFGEGAADELLNRGIRLLLIDKDVKCVERYANRCETAIGDAQSTEFLEEAGILRAHVAICAIGDDEEASNHAVINCKELGVPVIAKAKDGVHAKILKRLGADYVVYPEHDSGVRVARLLMRSAILDSVELYDGVFMMEVDAGGELAGHTLAELNLSVRFGVQVLLIIRDDKTIFPVDATTRVEAGDRVVLQGPEEALMQVVTLATPL